jgi:hypothetical protein
VAHDSCSIARSKTGHTTGDKSILRAFSPLVSLDVKLNYCTNSNLGALILSQETVAVNEQIACKAI